MVRQGGSILQAADQQKSPTDLSGGFRERASSPILLQKFSLETKKFSLSLLLPNAVRFEQLLRVHHLPHFLNSLAPAIIYRFLNLPFRFNYKVRVFC